MGQVVELWSFNMWNFCQHDGFLTAHANTITFSHSQILPSHAKTYTDLMFYFFRVSFCIKEDISRCCIMVYRNACLARKRVYFVCLQTKLQCEGQNFHTHNLVNHCITYKINKKSTDRLQYQCRKFSKVSLWNVYSSITRRMSLSVKFSRVGV